MSRLADGIENLYRGNVNPTKKMIDPVFLGGTLQRALHIAYLKIAMFTNRILRFT